MRAVRICVCPLALVILLSVVSSAFSAQVWTEQKITTTGTWSRGTPEIWGNEVYYADTRSGPGQIYAWDQAGGERLLLGGTEYRSLAGVYGDQLAVYHVNMNTSQYSLYLYDPVNGERLISATAGDISHPHAAAIYGNTVVWSDIRSGVSQVYAWDPVNGERHIAPTSYAQTNPRISGNTVVWEDARAGSDAYHTRVYTWNPTDGVKGRGYFNSPAIYQDEIFMFYPWDGYPLGYGGIYKWTGGPGSSILYSEQNSSWTNCYDPQASGDLYVWGGAANTSGLRTISAWDPVYGMNKVNQAASASGAASIYGHQVAWSDGHDIYVDTFAPEPSGLCALALGLAGMCGSILTSRRRRNSPRTHSVA